MGVRKRTEGVSPVADQKDSPKEKREKRKYPYEGNLQIRDHNMTKGSHQGKKGQKKKNQMTKKVGLRGGKRTSNVARKAARTKRMGWTATAPEVN